ncbi:acyl-CoA thioesterase [bacterium]|nr:MAG: acyl-CoA thioesterase [bacterium]
MKVILPILVHAFETDFGGVVSNTRYLEYLERGRYHLLHEAGLPVEETWANEGAMAVVRRVEADYLNFARHEERLELSTWASEWSGASVIVSHEIVRPKDGVVILRARQTIAFMNRSWRPTRVPKSYRDSLGASPV